MHRLQSISLKVPASSSSMPIVSTQDEIKAKKKAELALLKDKMNI